mgnify:CR=1 FL=1|tara:strand:+ start:3820 stop:4788 length:969 start_codon:yes stop_codon:yes gene_type:complete
MAQTLGDLGFTSFKDDDARKHAFLSMMSNSMASAQAAAFMGAPLGFAAFEPSMIGSEAAGPAFYDPSVDTPASHQEKYPEFHDIAFGLMETTASALDAPAAKSATPFIDPTDPILQIINKISDLISEEEIIAKLEEIMAIAPDVIDAFSALPDVEPLAGILVQIKPSLDLDATIEKLESVDLSVDMSGVSAPSIPVPSMPLADQIHLTIPNLGIADIFLKIIISAISAIAEVISAILRAIGNFIAAVMRGLVAIIEFLASLIIELIIQPILSLLGHLLKMPMFLAFISTVLVFVIGMVLLTIVGILIGTGLVAKGIQNLLGL